VREKSSFKNKMNKKSQKKTSKWREKVSPAKNVHIQPPPSHTENKSFCNIKKKFVLNFHRHFSHAHTSWANRKREKLGKNGNKSQ
jgi:hypothetical protein